MESRKKAVSAADYSYEMYVERMWEMIPRANLTHFNIV